MLGSKVTKCCFYITMMNTASAKGNKVVIPINAVGMTLPHKKSPQKMYTIMAEIFLG